MRKIVLTLLAIILLTGCEEKTSIYDNYKAVTNNTTIYTESIPLTYSEYEKKIENKESFVLLMWQTGCGHCQTFEPVLNEVIKKYNLQIYSINIGEITDTEYAKLKNKTFVDGTPTTIVFKEGVTQTKKLIGSKDVEDVIKFLVKYNYLEEIK